MNREAAMEKAERQGDVGSGPDLGVKIGSLTLKNPVMVASGTFGFGKEYRELFDISRLGAIVTKGLSLRPRAGNPPPRIAEVPGGLLNSIGLQNPGVEAFLERELPGLMDLGVPVIANIAGDSHEDYIEIASRLDRASGISAIEVNISCPNVREGGLSFGREPGVVRDLIRGIRRSTRKTLIVKLSPNVTDIVQIARAAEEGGADALSLINTLAGMAIDVRKMRPVLGNATGGLSGPAIKPVALRAVWEVAGSTELPIIGMGGIVTSDDALEFIMAGAHAVAVGSGMFLNPCAPLEIIEGIREFMIERGVGSLNELRGIARRGWE